MILVPINTLLRFSPKTDRSVWKQTLFSFTPVVTAHLVPAGSQSGSLQATC